MLQITHVRLGAAGAEGTEEAARLEDLTERL